MALFLNEEIFFYSRIRSNEFIHEGSQDLFKKSLKSPQDEVGWLVTGVGDNLVLPDIVSKEVSQGDLEESFRLVYETPYTKIYKRINEPEESF
jgi:hypothetical protein